MSTTAGGTLYLIFIQVTSRGLTFIGNQILLRYLSPTLLGIAVQLELVSVTVLYFARESLRVALQRQPVVTVEAKGKENNKNALQQQSQATVNLSYLTVGLGLIIASMSGLWYLHAADLEVLRSPHFTGAFYIYATATLVELCAEPFFVVIQQHSLYKERARAETSGAISRCVCACTTAFIATKQGLSPSVLPFAVGQLAYSIVLFGSYLQAASQKSQQQHFNLRPGLITSRSSEYVLSLFSKHILSLATTMYIQSIFKLLLTEGDHVILSFLSSLADQGAFALASNYGGLLARLVFQPIEESSRNIFGRLLSKSATTSTELATDTPHSSAKNTSTNLSAHKNRNLALSNLSTTLRTYTTLSLPLLALLPPVLPTLTPLILSPHWCNSSTTVLLQTYIYYIPFLAVNGILDAFVTSVATPAELSVQSIAMALLTILYGGACYVFLNVLRWGSAGLVCAGIVNMSCRIIWGGWFVGRWIGIHAPRSDGVEGKGRNGLLGVTSRFWRECVPSSQSIIVALGVGVWLNSNYGLSTVGDTRSSAMKPIIPGIDLDILDLGKVIAGAVVVGSTLIFYEGRFLLSILQTVVPERISSRIPFLRSYASRNPPSQQSNNGDEGKKEP